MSTLHVLSQSPFTDTRLGSCLRLLSANDGLLLCGDAVYALQPGTLPRETLDKISPALKLYVLDEDLQARNLLHPEWVTRIDYPAFVALSLHYDKVNTWL